MQMWKIRKVKVIHQRNINIYFIAIIITLFIQTLESLSSGGQPNQNTLTQWLY